MQAECSFDTAKRKFYRSFNDVFTVFGKIDWLASEVVLSLYYAIMQYALNVYQHTYAVESCPVNVRDKQSFNFTACRIFMKNISYQFIFQLSKFVKGIYKNFSQSN